MNIRVEQNTEGKEVITAEDQGHSIVLAELKVSRMVFASLLNSWIVDFSNGLFHLTVDNVPDKK